MCYPFSLNLFQQPVQYRIELLPDCPVPGNTGYNLILNLAKHHIAATLLILVKYIPQTILVEFFVNGLVIVTLSKCKVCTCGISNFSGMQSQKDSHKCVVVPLLWKALSVLEKFITSTDKLWCQFSELSKGELTVICFSFNRLSFYFFPYRLRWLRTALSCYSIFYSIVIELYLNITLKLYSLITCRAWYSVSISPTPEIIIWNVMQIQLLLLSTSLYKQFVASS